MTEFSIPLTYFWLKCIFHSQNLHLATFLLHILRVWNYMKISSSVLYLGLSARGYFFYSISIHHNISFWTKLSVSLMKGKHFHLYFFLLHIHHELFNWIHMEFFLGLMKMCFEYNFLNAFTFNVYCYKPFD